MKVAKPVAHKSSGATTILLYCSVVLLFSFAIFASLEDQKIWDKFKADHHCRLTAHLPGNAVATAKDGWACDDGQMHFR